MSVPGADAVLELLRRDGSVVVAAADVGDVDEWRRSVRRTCRAAGLRVRTGVNANGAVWAYHVDHVVTDAETNAAARAVDNLLSGKPIRPFHEIVREEKRKQLTVVGETTNKALQSERSMPGEIDLFVIEYSSRQHAFKVDDDRFLRQWYGSIALTDDNGEVIEKVGYVLAYTVAYEEMADPFDILDAETADLGHIAGVIFDPATGGMRPEVDDLIEPTGSGMLIIDSVKLEPAWRGYGLGPLLVGMVIEHLGEGRQLVALQPAPTEHRDAVGNVVDEISSTERSVAVDKLSGLWAELGFEPVGHNVWVLDLGVTTFAAQITAIRSRLGLT